MLDAPRWGRAVLLAGIAALFLHPSVASAQQFGRPSVTLWATREGLVGQTTANGHVIVERDHFVALPSRRALNALDRRDFMVRLEYRGKVVEAPVWDVGPWNIEDDYWNERRERFGDLPRWTPQAEAAFFNNHNDGRDRFGRYITIPTSIDLADGTFWDDLGMTRNDWIKVTFLWLDAPSPPAKATPVVVPKRLPELLGTPPPAAPPAPATSSLATMSASPNPVPAGLGRGTTTITWDTGDGSFARVYVWQQGGGEVPFADGAKGSAEAPWIQNGYTYEFRLYRGNTRTDRLRTLTVTGGTRRPDAASSPTLAPSVTPEPLGTPEPLAPILGEGVGSPASFEEDAPVEAPAELVVATSDLPPEALFAGPVEAPRSPWIAAAASGPGTNASISWDTSDGSPGRLYVWQPGGIEVPFAEGPSGTTEAPWIERGWTYEFRLYRGGERVASVAFVGGTLPATVSPLAAPSSRASLMAGSSPIDASMATISWDTGSDRPGQVFVSVAGGDEELFGQGPSGARDFRRRTGQAPYQFRLYEGLDRGVMLASLSL